MEKNKDKIELELLPYPGEVEITNFLKSRIEKIVYGYAEIPEEGYILEITPEVIRILSSSASGEYYAHQTLNQLKRQFGDRLPGMRIKDIPGFKWRGVHLDVSRHYFSVKTIKKLLKTMSHYKLNRFHWHLTDDQGWRIAVSRYPKLAEHAAYREEENGEKYGYCYTKGEIEEIVCYAEELFIEVVPEIELPGHARAAISAYPEISCNQAELPVPNRWGVFSDVYCPGKDETLEFLKNVFAEVMEMFPSDWIHIGGDECPIERWINCKDCQARMEKEGLTSERQLQSWMINEIAKYLKESGKTVIGWDEVLENGLDESIAVMVWRGDGKKAQEMAYAEQRKMIMTPNFYCYFDWKQTFQPDEKGAFGVTELSKTYNYDPLNGNPDYSEYVLGIQGNIWTERIKNEEELFYMAFPRVLAISENGWSQEKSDFKKFSQRVRKHFDYLNNQDIYPCRVME